VNRLVDLVGAVCLVLAMELLEGVHANASLDGAGSRATNAQMIIGDQSVRVRH